MSDTNPIHPPLSYEHEDFVRRLIENIQPFQYNDKFLTFLHSRCSFDKKWIDNYSWDIKNPQDKATLLVAEAIKHQYTSFTGPHCSMLGRICLQLIGDQYVCHHRDVKFLFYIMKEYQLLDPSKANIPAEVNTVMDRFAITWE